MSLADSHCHLDDEQFEGERDAVIDRALAAGVLRMVAIGTGDGPPDLEAAIRLADAYEPVYATAGIHPQYASRAEPEHLRRLEQVLQHRKCVALGEIGLDYYWKPFDADKQKGVFVEQMSIARAARKPIVIHTREAWSDTIALLEQHWAPTGLPCIMHCFSGGPDHAAEALALGFYISFAGIVTYPKATAVQAAARGVPSDRLLVETDAPYLAPVPHRGKRNEPAFVAHTANKIAELRGEEPARLAQAVLANLSTVMRFC